MILVDAYLAALLLEGDTDALQSFVRVCRLEVYEPRQTYPDTELWAATSDPDRSVRAWGRGSENGSEGAWHPMQGEEVRDVSS